MLKRLHIGFLSAGVDTIRFPAPGCRQGALLFSARTAGPALDLIRFLRPLRLRDLREASSAVGHEADRLRAQELQETIARKGGLRSCLSDLGQPGEERILFVNKFEVRVSKFRTPDLDSKTGFPICKEIFALQSSSFGIVP